MTRSVPLTAVLCLCLGWFAASLYYTQQQPRPVVDSPTRAPGLEQPAPVDEAPAINPHAQHETPHVAVSPSSPTRPPPTTPPPSPATATFADLVRSAARFRGEFVVLAFTNLGNVKFTINWLVSLARVGVNPTVPLLVCTDTASFDYLSLAGFNAVLLTEAMRREVGWPSVDADGKSNSTRTLDQGPQRYYTDSYRRLVRMKMALSAYVVRSVGVSLLFSDVDVVFPRRDPTNAFDDLVDRLDAGPSTVSMLILQDQPGNICTGFYIVRPSAAAQAFFTDLDKRMHESDAAGLRREDQQDFNALCMESRSPNNARPYTCVGEASFLLELPHNPPTDYLSGRLVFGVNMTEMYAPAIAAHWDLDRQPLASTYAYLIHANYITGAERKLSKLQSFGLWWADSPEVVEAALGPIAPYPESIQPPTAKPTAQTPLKLVSTQKPAAPATTTTTTKHAAPTKIGPAV